MDQNVKWLNDQLIENTMSALKKNNMTPYHVRNQEELLALLNRMIPEKSRVAVGGSMTLFETGVIDFLRAGSFEFWDRYMPGLDAEAIRSIYLKSFDADFYFTSTNAITQDGFLFNVDGTGNRVAAMIYGPRHVVVIAGVNKLVKDIDAAIARYKEKAAPANAKRLNRHTPCASTGYCTDCNAPDRICSDFVLMKHQIKEDRVHVVLIDESFGY